MIKSNQRYKQILIDFENYNALKDLGKTGDSFNLVITKLIKNFKGVNH